MPTRLEERIPVVIDTLLGVWEEFPDLRLGQLIECAVGTGGADVFNVEDDVMIQRLLNFRDAQNDRETGRADS